MKTTKLLAFDYLQVFEYKFILLASKVNCGVWRIDLQDSNDRKVMDEMLNEKNNYSKLFLA
jgi:hypothetical protein